MAPLSISRRIVIPSPLPHKPNESIDGGIEGIIDNLYKLFQVKLPLRF